MDRPVSSVPSSSQRPRFLKFAQCPETVAGTMQMASDVETSMQFDAAAAGFPAGSAVRTATSEEEAWLDSEDEVRRREEELLIQQADFIFRASQEKMILDEAEDFNRNVELKHWMQVEAEIYASKEAEHLCSLEEAVDLELRDIVNAENAECHLMMKALQQGAKYLVDEGLIKAANYQTLVYTHISAQKLVELMDRAIHSKLEEQRREAEKKGSLAAVIQKQLEDAAKAERIQFQSQIAQLEGEKTELLEMLDHEKDRTTCRICFTRPRDVLPLPCMHFDYCSHCLHKHQKKNRNFCPTCRTPISGVLTLNLSIG